MAIPRCDLIQSLVSVGFCIVTYANSAGLAAAQVLTGTAEGRVTDIQGGVLAGATITATNTGTAAAFVVPTTGDGLYRFPFLPSGDYDFRADLSGFRSE